MTRNFNLTLLSSLLALAAVSANAATTSSAKAPAGFIASHVTNPYSPAYQHEYRHGVIPTRSVHESMKQWARTHVVAAATNAKTLSYGGGVAGVGVLSGQSKVYLVFYGTQWGTSSTDGNGNLAFTGDTAGAAGAAQQMFKGIGTNGELWSAELTQWCDGVATGATSCTGTAGRIGYNRQNPTDSRNAAPSSPVRTGAPSRCHLLSRACCNSWSVISID